MPDGYLERILRSKVYDVAVETPLEKACFLSERFGAEFLLKREDLQSVFSFKIRGAYSKIARLSRADLDRGVVASSAGNHAQGVALSARKLGAKAVIVMPATTPDIKIRAVKQHGARVVLFGDSYTEAYAKSQEIIAETGGVFIHPYDDPDVIAGQGTIALELLRQQKTPIDAVFVPIGGGGLAAGVAAFLKRVQPTTRIIGVEPVDSCAMKRSIDAGRIVELPEVGLFADGVAVKRVGDLTFRLCQDLLDDIVLVDTDAICAAIKDVFEETRSVMEPAGALSVAGAKAWLKQSGLDGGCVVAILSGANINFERLRHVSERAELGERHEAIIAATIPERPGSFRELCAALGERSITEFNYRYSDSTDARVFMGVRIASTAETGNLLASLAAKGFRPVDLTDNETAKIHVRYLVGGRAPGLEGERIFRFQFPERPGALGQFLRSLKSNWNISLFHYRNHGADYGRVLIGIQIPPEDEPAFATFLNGSAYVWTEETDNAACKLFLE